MKVLPNAKLYPLKFCPIFLSNKVNMNTTFCIQHMNTAFMDGNSQKQIGYNDNEIDLLQLFSFPE